VRLAVSLSTWQTWEREVNQLDVRLWPALVGFLGYDPHPPRRWERGYTFVGGSWGLTQRELAQPKESVHKCKYR